MKMIRSLLLWWLAASVLLVSAVHAQDNVSSAAPPPFKAEELDALLAPIAGEEDMIAATIFRHSPDHLWYYYPDMTPDEVIFITFHNSDHEGVWRCPHTAFHDTTRPGAVIRKSMEFRGVAYFTKDSA